MRKERESYIDFLEFYNSKLDSSDNLATSRFEDDRQSTVLGRKTVLTNFIEILEVSSHFFM